MTNDETQPITAGDLLDALAGIDDGIAVCFDFCGLVPTAVDSYRGYYDHLAFGWSEPDGVNTLNTVGKLRENVSAAMGRIFQGYKGGDFLMHRGAPLWVAEYGRSFSTAVCGVHVTDWCVTIRTAHCEDWAGGEARAMETLRRYGIIGGAP